MKEVHLFYAPDVAQTSLLPPDEARHALRVLRLTEGDTLLVTDGRGTFFDAEITAASPHRCLLRLLGSRAGEPLWRGRTELAMAPTKNMERTEWLAEKATEVGIDRLVMLDCANSERRIVKTERVERIVTAAMKQSHKCVKPEVEGMTAFKTFVETPFSGQRFIAHCYLQEDIDGTSVKPCLADVLAPDADVQILVGPEGDFSIDEVRLAQAAGFRSVSLGKSRLRTETAALAAVHTAYLKKML